MALDPESINLNSGWGRTSIYDVWEDEVEKAFDEIQEAVLDYPIIAVDTEFPGVLVRPIISYRDKFQYRYFTTKANVDMLKVIQVSFFEIISFCNKKKEGWH